MHLIAFHGLLVTFALAADPAADPVQVKKAPRYRIYNDTDEVAFVYMSPEQDIAAAANSELLTLGAPIPPKSDRDFTLALGADGPWFNGWGAGTGNLYVYPAGQG